MLDVFQIYRKVTRQPRRILYAWVSYYPNTRAFEATEDENISTLPQLVVFTYFPPPILLQRNL